MSYSVYTPPDWNSNEALPLLVLLHGAKDNNRSFDRYGVGQHLDKLYLDTKLPRVVIAIPDGELGFWENWKDGSRLYRDWVIKDMLPVVQSEYQTLSCPENCFVTGVSMGAHGAMRFAHYEPNQFSSVAAISGLILSRNSARPSLVQRLMTLFIPVNRIWGDLDAAPSEERIRLDPFHSWVNKNQLWSMPLFLTWGTKDKKSIRESNNAFHLHLTQNERPHQYEVYEGKHLWEDWKNPIAQSIRFHLVHNRE